MVVGLALSLAANLTLCLAETISGGIMGGSSLNPVKAIKSIGKTAKKTLMSGVNEVRRVGRKVDNALEISKDLQDPLGEARNVGYEFDKATFRHMNNPFMPDVPEPPAQVQVAPTMDAEEIKRARRRKGGAGASTILSGGNPDGLGG
jgi:hypothetical protein